MRIKRKKLLFSTLSFGIIFMIFGSCYGASKDITPLLSLLLGGTSINGKAELGSLSGAEITVSNLDGAPVASGYATTSEQLETAGKFSIKVNAGDLPEYFVVSASGGLDLDPDDNGIRDTGIKNEGVIHAFVPKSYALANNFRLNPVTEMIYQLVLAEYPNGGVDLSLTELTNVLDEKCRTLLADSGSYIDALTFEPVIHKVKSKIPWNTILNKLVLAIHEGETGVNIRGRVKTLMANLETSGIQTLTEESKIIRIEDIDADRVITSVTPTAENLVASLEQSYSDESGAFVHVQIVRVTDNYSQIKTVVSKAGHTFSFEGKSSILQGMICSEANVAIIASKLVQITRSDNDSLNINIDKSLTSKISDNGISFEVDGRELSTEEMAVLLDDPLIDWVWSEADNFNVRAQVFASTQLSEYSGTTSTVMSDGRLIVEMSVHQYDEFIDLQEEGVSAIRDGFKNLILDSVTVLAGIACGSSAGLACGALPLLSAYSTASDNFYIIRAIGVLGEKNSDLSSRIRLLGPLKNGELVPGERYIPIILLRSLDYQGSVSLKIDASYLTSKRDSTGDLTRHSKVRFYDSKKIGSVNVKTGKGYFIVPPQRLAFVYLPPDPDITYPEDPEIALTVDSEAWDRGAIFPLTESLERIYTGFTYVAGSDTISLDASSSLSPDGTITEYKWTHSGVEIASGRQVEIRRSLVDNNGGNEITLKVRGLNGFTGEVTKFLTLPPAGTVFSAGQIWMDRNLGATRVATSSTDAEAYGDLYQWGRLTDGHEKRTSGTTSILSNSTNPGHGSFILPRSEPYNWMNFQDDRLWQGESGVNNPCPSGFRLPTMAEWEIEYNSWNSHDAASAFASPLKLTLAGRRDAESGTFYELNSVGQYWSSTIDNSYGIPAGIAMQVGSVYNVGVYYRAHAVSVRCIKD